MAKKSIMSDGPKTGGSMPQAKAPASKSSKKEKTSKPGKKEK
jgi:hypothetical protein